MTRRSIHSNARSAGGYTLIDALIAISIISILSFLAVQGGSAYLRRARRTEAVTLLHKLRDAYLVMEVDEVPFNAAPQLLIPAAPNGAVVDVPVFRAAFQGKFRYNYYLTHCPDFTLNLIAESTQPYGCDELGASLLRLTYVAGRTTLTYLNDAWIACTAPSDTIALAAACGGGPPAPPPPAPPAPPPGAPPPAPTTAAPPPAAPPPAPPTTAAPPPAAPPPAPPTTAAPPPAAPPPAPPTTAAPPPAAPPPAPPTTAAPPPAAPPPAPPTTAAPPPAAPPPAPPTTAAPPPAAPPPAPPTTAAPPPAAPPPAPPTTAAPPPAAPPTTAPPPGAPTAPSMTFDCGDNGPGWDGPILCNECFSFGSPTPGCDSQLRGLCGDALAVSKVSGGPVFCACVDSAVDAGTCL